MKARIVRALADLWWKRPIIVSHMRYVDRFTNGYCDGFNSALERESESVPPSTEVRRHASRQLANGATLAAVD